MIKYVIIPTNEVTDEMRNASTIEGCVNLDRSKTVFDYFGEKPSCFNAYTELTKLEWYDLYYNTEKNLWNPEIDFIQ